METRVRVRTTALVLLLIAAATLLPAAQHTIVLPPLQQYRQADADILSFDEKLKRDVAAYLEGLSAREGFEPLFGDHIIRTVTETRFAEGSIFSAFKPGSAAYLLNLYESDTLIFRRYTRVGEFVNLEILSFSSEVGYTQVFSRIITDGNVDEMMRSCRVAVLEYLTGTRTGELVINRADPYTDRIRIDGQLLSPADTLLEYMPVGAYTLESLSSEKTVDSQKIQITAGSPTIFAFPSLPKQISSFSLVTYPHGALLNVEGRDIGTTPLSFTLEDRDTGAAFLSHERFDNTHSIGLRETETELVLRPDWLSREEQAARAQRDVYTHLGLTIATLPISIISVFMYDVTGRSAWQIGSAGGAAVSSLLFVQTLFSIADYYHSTE
jgi:hypothetical protein